MTPTRRRRFIAVGLILAAVAIATTLGALAISDNMTYLFSPSEVLAGHAPGRAKFRLGGVVLEQSVNRESGSLKVDFVVTDRFHNMPVQYTGVLPDLFRAGQSIIATGEMDGSHFVADQVLAKHDETYMPKEVAEAIAKAKTMEAAQHGASGPHTAQP
ncbi:MAG: cytochrome c maturation protein CcmE [Rudaea sp.]